ncbi:His Kinase A (phospho-acceptor) domain-containing protein [Pilibacter termitis]|uniref:histidine kinase n=1 Tax=Pilibacter termitis TaxID=263852 RepID=A0A1T4RAC1_9ENTE|nr:HAMP domain-containing sensor histidine kinase [Pilibacter termitis]SKA12877.1 His Kinase A (phospho-acceptor) domain-containing protein [Pilibacter termitis]
MEISELLAEGIFTVLIMLLVNIAILMILSMIVSNNDDLVNVIFSFKRWFVAKFDSSIFYSWQKFLIALLIIIDVVVVYWRLRRRYHQMQLRHIIAELHYISMGNYDHRIPFELNGDLGNVIDSINSLVDSTMTAIEDEREVEKSKDEMISNVSHDIRTPLTSIIGYLGLIEEKNYSNDEELENFAHTAYTKAKQMQTLLEDLFEYTKVRQPSANLHITRFDLMNLLAQVAIDFELEAEKHQVEIQVAGNQEHIPIEADAEKLVRVFENLLSNAFKYGRKASIIQLLLEKGEGEVNVIVRNNGEKIPEDKLHLLFDRFYRVDTARTTEIGGSGLGLAITQNIIELHNGKIHAESDENWTSFIFTLPLPKEK